MRTYCVAVVVRSSVSEAEQKKVVKFVKDSLKDLKVTKEDEMGEKPLAYPIKHEKTGVYFVFSVEGESIPSDFEKKLINNENVLRHLVVRTK